VKAERFGNSGEEEGSIMKKNLDTKAASRREFFGKAGLGAAVAVGATVGVAPGAAKAEASAATSAGYAETAHVKTYYDLAK
jgi:hypothetical protein